MKKIYLIAAILAVLAGVLLYGYMANLEEKYREDYDQTVVATVTIPENTQVTPDMIALEEIPGEGIHPSAATSIESVIGGISSQTIYEGEQILKSKIKKTDENSGKISYCIPEGMRAITIGVDTITGISGFIRAMDRVDIIVITMKEEEGKTKEVATLLLENIEVLAIGTDQNSRNEEYNPTEAVSVITLLTTPADAVKLSLAGSSGKINAILRSPADHADVSIPTVEGKNLIK